MRDFKRLEIILHVNRRAISVVSQFEISNTLIRGSSPSYMGQVSNNVQANNVGAALAANKSTQKFKLRHYRNFGQVCFLKIINNVEQGSL